MMGTQKEVATTLNSIALVMRRGNRAATLGEYFRLKKILNVEIEAGRRVTSD
jgi:hypothetical protein